MRNCLSFAVDVSYTLADDAVGRCGVVQPDSVLNMPCDAVYTSPFEILFTPRVDRCENFLMSRAAVIGAVEF